MAALDTKHCRSTDPSTDPNNNFSPSMKGYSLRPRTARKCEEEDSSAEPEVWRPSRSKKKQKSMPLSKYRRKTANARERSRMREINEAFETLRRAIPQMSSRECSSEKLTKITTLKLAMKYISALNHALHDQDLESDGESLLSEYTLTPPEIHDLSITSPDFTDHSLASDFFNPQLVTDIGTDLLHLTDNTLVTHLPLYSDAPLAPMEPCMSVTEFGNSSYVFDDAPFMADFS